MEGNIDSKERSTAATPTGSEGWEWPQAEISDQGTMDFGKEVINKTQHLSLQLSVGFC